MTTIDDRIVLPLERTRLVAQGYCLAYCFHVLGPDGRHLRVNHEDECLVPLIEQRDRDVTDRTAVGGITPDCRDGKCTACTGCQHGCHG